MTKREFIKKYKENFGFPLMLYHGPKLKFLEGIGIAYENVFVDSDSFAAFVLQVFINTPPKTQVRVWLRDNSGNIRLFNSISLINFDDGIYCYCYIDMKLKRVSRRLIERIIGEFEEQIYCCQFSILTTQLLSPLDELYKDRTYNYTVLCIEEIKKAVIQLRGILERDKSKDSWFMRKWLK